MGDNDLYRLGPDGLPARIVGPWVERKDHFVDRYAHMFATGMKNQWPRRAYVELFAGPGLSWDKGHRRFVDGSAIRSLDREFTDRFFVDLDRAAVDALRARIEAKSPGLVAPVRQGDCNDQVDEIRSHIPATALTLVFVDPTNFQVRMDSLRRLTAGRKMDLLVTFHDGILQRLTKVAPKSVDEFFGTGEWKGCLDLPREQRAPALRALYARQLGEFDYLAGRPEDVATMRNTVNRVIYSLVLFSRNPRGHDFWRKALAVDERGQVGIWD